MKIKLNFKVDEATLNGHVYPKEVLKKSLDKSLESHLFVTEHFDGDANAIPVENIIGEVKDYEINEKNEIFIDVSAMRKKELFEDEDIRLTTAGYGTFKSEKTVGEDFILTSLFLTKEEI